MFAQHSTEKPVTVSSKSSVLLEIQDPKLLCSGTTFEMPSVISSVQLKRRESVCDLTSYTSFVGAKEWGGSALCVRRRLLALSFTVFVAGCRKAQGSCWYHCLCDCNFNCVKDTKS